MLNQTNIEVLKEYAKYIGCFIAELPFTIKHKHSQ